MKCVRFISEVFFQSLDFVASVVQDFDIGKDKVRIGLIEFSAGASTHFNLQKYFTKAEILRAIKSTPKSDGGTNTHLALDAARTQVFNPKNGMRWAYFN